MTFGVGWGGWVTGARLADPCKKVSPPFIFDTKVRHSTRFRFFELPCAFVEGRRGLLWAVEHCWIEAF